MKNSYLNEKHWQPPPPPAPPNYVPCWSRDRRWRISIKIMSPLAPSLRRSRPRKGLREWSSWGREPLTLDINIRSLWLRKEPQVNSRNIGR